MIRSCENSDLFEGVNSMENHRPRRQSLKTHHPNWKEKLRQNCLRRVRADRAHFLWKIRSNGKLTLNRKVIVESVFQEIVSDELKKIKQLSPSAYLEISTSNAGDSLWEYDGLDTASEELMLEMENALYEDLKAESIRRDTSTCLVAGYGCKGLNSDNTEELEAIEQAEEEEDNYLAQIVFEQMQLNDDQGGKDDNIWCPICKPGELRENLYLIYCTHCGFQLDIQSDKVSLDFLRGRLAEVHMEHLEKGCKATPKFRLETKFNMTALYIQCQTCNTFEIVL